MQFCENFADFIHRYADSGSGYQPNLKVVLKPDTEVLDEVVVVAYGTASRQSITGAVASIDSKKLEMRLLLK